MQIEMFDLYDIVCHFLSILDEGRVADQSSMLQFLPDNIGHKHWGMVSGSI
jgi:hypothetical protein